MKPIIYPLCAMAGIIAGCFIARIIFATTDPETKPAHADLPPGWKLQSDGAQWKWVDTEGWSWTPLETRQQAIENRLSLIGAWNDGKRWKGANGGNLV